MKSKSCTMKGSSKKAAATYAVAEFEAYDDVPTATVVAEDQELMSKHHHSNSTHQAGAVTHGIKQWPPALRDKLIQTFKKPSDERKAGELLGLHNWPEGLKTTVYKSSKKIPLRFFIVDDSGVIFSFAGNNLATDLITLCLGNFMLAGSMILNDGKKVVKQGNQTK